MHILSISQLEESSGLPRSKIYYYCRVGLLPPGQKSGGSPALYGEEHLARLQEIIKFRQEGLSLAQVRERIHEKDFLAAPESNMIEEKTSETRNLILHTAARYFAASGYRGARIADIIAEAQLAPYAFYRHFESKRELFVEVVETFVEQKIHEVESVLATEPDPIVRHIFRTVSFLDLRSMSPEMLTFVRAESLGADEETRNLVLRTYRRLASHHWDELKLARSVGHPSAETRDELLAHAIVGAMENTSMRLSWDDQFSVEDFIWANLEVFLALRAVYLGPLDVAKEKKKYAELVHQLDQNPDWMQSWGWSRD
jgi:AcrR family transcriptional regulator